jgi:hypothetical protein
MPSVAASERGGAQTAVAQEPAGAVAAGLNGAVGGGGSPFAADRSDSRTPLERAAGAGESPVGDVGCWAVHRDREYCPTRDIGWEAGPTTAQG